jgi:hypothetical protein
MLMLRRLGPFGIALALFDLWRRVPLRQRRRLIGHARRQATRFVPAARGLRERATAR